MYALRGRSVLDVLASYDDLWYSSVMVVKDRPEVFEVLDRAEAALREATSDVERTKAILEMVREKPGITVAELASQFHLSEEAVIAFVQTVGEILGADRSLSVEAARRGGLLAAASQAWENELGPLLGTAEVRELLGVSRQRVDELLRSKRLIALRRPPPVPGVSVSRRPAAPIAGCCVLGGRRRGDQPLDRRFVVHRIRR